MDGKIAAYRRADTMGKSQVELILMVYDGAIKSLRTAADHYRDRETEAGYEELQKTKRFVTHLYSTLDQKKGGEVTENLGKIYVWVISQLHVIEATRDLEQLDSVVTVLENLRSGWVKLKDQQVPAPSEKSDLTEKSNETPEITEEFVTTA